jgi:hypothetical protein
LVGPAGQPTVDRDGGGIAECGHVGAAGVARCSSTTTRPRSSVARPVLATSGSGLTPAVHTNVHVRSSSLGLSGMPRRIADYSGIDRWTPLNLLSTVGAVLTGLSILPFVWNVVVSLRKGRATGDDPWEGNSLEWATTSPPPHHNFHHLPEIRSERPVFDLRHGLDHPEAGGHTDPQTSPSAADHSRAPQASVSVGHPPSGPGRPYSSALTTACGTHSPPGGSRRNPEGEAFAAVVFGLGAFAVAIWRAHTTTPARSDPSLFPAWTCPR